MSSTRFTPKRALPLLASVYLTVVCGHVLAANECKIEYGYHTGSGLNLSNHVQTEFLNINQTKTFNQSQMNYVKNLKDNKVLFSLQGAPNITVDNNVVNPPVGFYLSAVTLKTVKCLNQTSAAFESPEALIDAFKQTNNSVEQVTNGLKNTFGLGAQQTAQLLKTAGYSPAEIAGAIKTVFNISDQQTIQILKVDGYTGAAVANALKTGLNTTAQNSANYLKSLFGATTSQVAQWLKSAAYPLDDVAQALLNIETDPQKILQALKSSFNLSADQIITMLKRINALVTPRNCNTTGCKQAAQWLKNIGYALNDVLKSLKTHFNISVQAAYDIAKNIYGQSNAVAQQALAFAGYSAEQISSVIGERSSGAGSLRPR